MKADGFNAKTGVRLFACVTTLIAATAFAEPDYGDFKKAVTNFLASMDTLVVELPKVKDADGAAKAIDVWAAANAGAADAGEAFLQKNPELFKESKPPAEFMAYLGQCLTLKSNHLAVPTGFGTLIKQYGTNATVAVSISRFQRSVGRLNKLARLGVKDDD